MSCTRLLMIERNRDRLANSTSSSVSIAQTQTAGPSVESGPVSTCQLLTGVGSSESRRSATSIVFAEISISFTSAGLPCAANGLRQTRTVPRCPYGNGGSRVPQPRDRAERYECRALRHIGPVPVPDPRETPSGLHRHAGATERASLAVETRRSRRSAGPPRRRHCKGDASPSSLAPQPSTRQGEVNGRISGESEQFYGNEANRRNPEF